MADRPFMQFYGSDLVGDTLHLSAEQIGAYMLMIIAMWNAGGILPNDPVKLARISRLTAVKWAKISPDILDLFDMDDDAIWHKRVQKEIEKMNEKREKNSRSGSLGGTARALKYNNASQANAKETLKRNSSIARATPEPEPEIEKRETDVSPKKTGRLRDGERELRSTLDELRAKAVVDHRIKLGKPLTAHAATLLGKAFAECDDPNVAADVMIANGWQGFKRSWLDRVNVVQHPVLAARHSQPTSADIARKLIQEMEDAAQQPDRAIATDQAPARQLGARSQG